MIFPVTAFVPNREPARCCCVWQDREQRVCQCKCHDILNINMLTAEDRRRYFRNKLYPLVESMYSILAEPITGILLEFSNYGLMHLLEHIDCLREVIDKIVAGLRAYFDE